MTANRSLVLALVAVAAILLLWSLRSIAMLVAFALLLAYALEPLVRWLERRRLARGAASAVVVLGLVVVAVVGLGSLIPQVASQAAAFLSGLPRDLERLVTQARTWAEANDWGTAVDPVVGQLQAALPQFGTWVVGWVGRQFGNVLQWVGLAVLPVLAYYLLAEGEAVRASLLRFLPEQTHERLRAAGDAVDRALASYVRGQAVVCLVSGAAAGTLLALLGIPHALLLAVAVTLGEILPFLGFWMAAIAIGVTGFGVSPLHALLGLVAYALVNTLVGLFVTPRVMGKHLKMHPFVVTVSVLAGGELLGPAGVLLALPAAAVLQALVQEFAPRRAAAPAAQGGSAC